MPRVLIMDIKWSNLLRDLECDSTRIYRIRKLRQSFMTLSVLGRKIRPFVVFLLIFEQEKYLFIPINKWHQKQGNKNWTPRSQGDAVCFERSWRRLVSCTKNRLFSTEQSMRASSIDLRPDASIEQKSSIIREFCDFLQRHNTKPHTANSI